MPATVPQTGGGALTQAILAQIQQISQFGNGGSLTGGGGDIYDLIVPAGQSPGATGADNVLAVFSLPANSFDVAGRVLNIEALGTFANNTNSKRVKVIFNPATAVVGSTVGTGGTTIVDTGAWTTTGLTGFNVQAQVTKYGLPNSNTQLATPIGVVLGMTHGGIGSGSAINLVTAVENAPILIAVTGNAATAATDILLYQVQINVFN